ncbi:hypothetical protein [uncultured Muribaculum sp.]|uniref:hypothetical protein n=1 Tax=uncultured Muribaculum sp. TaxID=1918613 RepID=UPI0025DA2CB5|nr:hypothetical protein [uncultured Muribaculum sp.]
MKKIISGMLIFASLAGGMSAFTSCKDTDDDQYAVLQREDFRLMEQIQALQTALEEAEKQFAADLEQARKDLDDEITKGYGSKVTFEELAQKIKTLEGQICKCDDLAEKLNNLKTEILKEVDKKGYLDNTALKKYLDDNGYLTSIPDEYLTDSELDTKLTEYLKSSDLKTEVDKILTAYNYLTAETLKEALDNLGYKNYDDTNIKNDVAQLRAALEKLGFTVTDDNGTITVTPPTWASDSEALNKAVAEAQWVAANKTALENLINTLGSLDPSKLLTKEDAASTYLTKEDFENYKKGLTNALDEFVTTYNNVAKNFDGMKSDFTNLTDLLTDWVQWRADIAAKVAANEAAIKALHDKYDLVNQRLDAMITSIVAEGAWNPVFGTFAVPAGIASNVAMAYYGEMGKVEFPYDGGLYEFDGEMVITTKDMQMLGVTSKTFEGTVLLGEENGYKGNAGTIYMTVNPGNADMTGKTFTLVNSQNQENGMAIETPVKSDQVLTFGYTHGRAAQDVSLYEAGATLTPENIASCRVEIEPGLKSAASQFINNRNGSSLASLMRAVYEQLNGILPRMAVKAEWEYTTSKWDDTSAAWVDATEQGIVRSGLDIAATAFKPLSYKSLEGKKFNRRLPIYEEIKIDWDKLIPEIEKIDIKPIDLSNIKIDFKLSNVDFSEINKDLTVTVKGEVDIKGEKQEIELTGQVNPDNLQNFIDQMQAAFEEQVKNSNDDINEQFKKIMTDLQNQINSMILNVNTQINDMLDKLVEDIKNNIDGETGKYFDKVNNLINRYNSIANRINKVLENPNHYMQVTMLFKNSEGGFSFLSTNEAAPSSFTLGAGNSLLLFPTSYNAEIISPAFKKFVGICDAVNLATGKSAQDGDAAAKAALDKANKGANFDQVIDGTNLRVATGDLTAGFKYVVAYSALDYRGFTSTNKYYFQVNK